jgi:hypothetical protein
MPGITPLPVSSCVNGVPSAALCRMVSSNRITPLTNSSAPSVVNNSSRYARRRSSVDSTPIDVKRFAIVPSLSSAARMPLPSATRAEATLARSVSRCVPTTPLLRDDDPPHCGAIGAPAEYGAGPM